MWVKKESLIHNLPYCHFCNEVRGELSLERSEKILYDNINAARL